MVPLKILGIARGRIFHTGRAHAGIMHLLQRMEKSCVSGNIHKSPVESPDFTLSRDHVINFIVLVYCLIFTIHLLICFSKNYTVLLLVFLNGSHNTNIFLETGFEFPKPTTHYSGNHPRTEPVCLRYCKVTPLSIFVKTR